MYIDDNSILTLVQYRYNYIIIYRPAANESPGVMLNDIRQTDNVKESNENANNDYELLDKYSQAADAAEVRQNPQPKQQHGDYKLTQCLAYIPVTHGNKHNVTEATSGGVRGQYMDKADTLDTETYAVI